MFSASVNGGDYTNVGTGGPLNSVVGMGRLCCCTRIFSISIVRYSLYERLLWKVEMINGDWNSGWSQLQCKLCLLTCSWSSVERVCAVRSLWQPNHSCNVFWGNILMLSNNMMPNASIFDMEVCFFKNLLLCCKNRNNQWNSNYFDKCGKKGPCF